MWRRVCICLAWLGRVRRLRHFCCEWKKLQQACLAACSQPRNSWLARSLYPTAVYTNRCMKRQTMRKILFLFLLSHFNLAMGQTFEDKLSSVFQNLPIFDSPEKIMEDSGVDFTRI